MNAAIDLFFLVVCVTAWLGAFIISIQKGEFWLQFLIVLLGVYLFAFIPWAENINYFLHSVSLAGE